MAQSLGASPIQWMEGENFRLVLWNDGKNRLHIYIYIKCVFFFFMFSAAVYANQEAFGNSATANMSMNQVISQFGDLAQKSLSVSKDNFVAGLNNRTLDLELRTAWKYACSRGITGTPIFLLNGVTAPAESTWSVQQWKTLLNQYL